MQRPSLSIFDVEHRARASFGTSSDAIYAAVSKLIRRGADATSQATRSPGSVLFDIGCGTGTLHRYLADVCHSYVGLDVMRYAGLPSEVDLEVSDLDAPRWPVADASADITVSVETIEHLENPRAFFRELHRITKPGGMIVVTTPNQLSLLSKLTLVLKNQFNAFQDRPGLYPAHRTALLEIDLIRLAQESGLIDAKISYSNCGRIPGTSAHWPARLGMRGRAFSDNVILSARRDGNADNNG